MTQQTAATHTPGPWTVLDEGDGGPAIVSEVGTPRPIVAWLNSIKPDDGFIGCGGVWKANARLIAAAPELRANQNPDLLATAAALLADYHPEVSNDLIDKAEAEQASIALASPQESEVGT